MTVREEIAKNLLYYRKSKNITQKQLAEKIGVKNSSVSNWEKGVNSIDIDTLHLVCKALDVSINDMFGCFSNSMEKQPTTQAENNMLIKYRKLNDIGKAKADEYIADLLINPKYTQQVKTPDKTDIATDIIEEYKQDLARATINIS